MEDFEPSQDLDEDRLYRRTLRLWEEANQFFPEGYLEPIDSPDILRHSCYREFICIIFHICTYISFQASRLIDDNVQGPQTPDDLPVIGRSLNYRNLWYNSGKHTL